MVVSGLSVVIPVFNGACFVEEAVDSVLAQSAPPRALQVCLINDASTDGSDAVCRQLAQRHRAVEYVALPRNLGVAGARNEGIRRARHEYLAFLDQDDRWMADKLALQGAVFAERPDTSHVLGMQKFFLDGVSDYPSWCRDHWKEGPQPGYLLSALLIRTERFRQIGMLDEAYLYSDDVDWFARARQAGGTEVMLPDIVLDRRLHAHNASALAARASHELLHVIKAKLERHR
ncbi:glycosyltransferase family A protein [Pigmentiphaga sp. YJ18]|uniref:glycosyltransferase family 2 protein n=1 Tax=Pigmentiphaga sp. YJ18 TaxID=3134907 RepID=UPI003115F9CB